MYKKLSLLLLVIICFSACKKGSQNTGCSMQACTDVFESIGVVFKDKNNNGVGVINYKAVDLRTNKEIKVAPPAPNIDYVAGYVIIIDDGSRNDLAPGGDSIQVTATNPATNEVSTTLFKISTTECNCHVEKVSGPDVITFSK